MRAWFIALCLLPSIALAQVPSKLGYQGRLLNADSTPATGVVAMTFSLFSSATGGTALWSEVQQVPLTDGYYAVVLGDVTAISPSVFDGSELFLEVSVGGSALTPRQRVDSVAYAVTAGSAHDLTGGAVNASSISVGGNTVINSSGKLVGSATVSHDNTLTGDGSATPLGVDPTQVQLRIAQACSTGSFMVGVNATGAVVCGVPDAGQGGVTSVDTGAGLTGGPITSTGTIGIATGGVTNQMLANPSVTIGTGIGLSGGGSVPLGGSVTLNNTGILAVTGGGGVSASTTGGTVTLGTAPGGDLGGTLDAATVMKINGVPIASVAPVDSQVLTFNGTSGQWTPITPPAGTISGITPGPGISGGGSSGNVTINNTGVLSLASGGGVNVSGPTGAVTLSTAAGGDLSGGLDAAKVIKINGVAVASGTPNNNDVLTYNGATQQWTPAPAQGTGGVLSVAAAAPLNSSGGQNPSISLTSPTATNQFLRADGTGTAWTEGPIQATDLPSLSGSYVDLTSAQTVGGAKTFSGNVTVQGTLNASLSASNITSGVLPQARGGLGAALSPNADGQLLIGSSGGSYALGTLTPGTGISVTNAPGSITIAATGAPPTGTAGGDLSSSYPNPTVAKINGSSLGSTTPTAGNLLVGSGTQWASVPVGGDATLSSSGTLSLAANGVAAGTYGSSGLIPSITVDSTGRVTKVTTSAASGGTVTSVATGNGLTGGPITNSGTLSVDVAPTAGLSATLGSGTQLGIAANGVTPAMVSSGTYGISINGNAATAGTANTATTAGNVTGVVAPANGGTGLNAGPTQSNHFLRANNTGTAWMAGPIGLTDLPITTASTNSTGPANGQCVAPAPCQTGATVLSTQCQLTSAAGTGNLQDAMNGTCTYNCGAGGCSCLVLTTCIGP